MEPIYILRQQFTRCSTARDMDMLLPQSNRLTTMHRSYTQYTNTSFPLFWWTLLTYRNMMCEYINMRVNNQHAGWLLLW